MGVSVFNAAVTTLGSAIVLMNSYVIFFERFGIFVFINILFSCIFAFVFLMAIMLQIGPMNGEGTIVKKSDQTQPVAQKGDTLNPLAQASNSDADEQVVQT